VVDEFLLHIQGIENLHLISPSVIHPTSCFTQCSSSLKSICYRRPRYPLTETGMLYAPNFTLAEVEILSQYCVNVTGKTLQVGIYDELVGNLLSAPSMGNL
jgi:hypothetical protein